jgi:hypothetical protein
MGRIIDELNAKMPTYFNLDNPEYKAIWGKIDYTPRATIEGSEDYRCGAIANELEYLRSTTDYITKTYDPDDIDGVFLEILVERFAGIERLVDESDEGLRNRFYALFRRGGNTSWIAGSMVLDVLGYFFSSDNLYLVENHVATNLITNGTFETAVGAEWSINTAGSTALAASTDSPFEESYAMQWDVDASGSAGSLSQAISGCAAGTYTLTFFIQDEGNVSSPLKVSVQRSSDSYYYDFSDDSWGAAAASYDVPGSSGEYALRKLTLINEGTENLTVTFENQNGVSEAVQVDYIEFGENKSYPSFRVMAVNSGQSGDFLNMFPDGEDPVSGESYDYDEAGYLDNDYIGGFGAGTTTDYIEEILDIIKPAGVKAEFLPISRAV